MKKIKKIKNTEKQKLEGLFKIGKNKKNDGNIPLLRKKA